MPDTPQNRQLEACEKAMELALHTIKICATKKNFLPEYQEALTNDIIRCSKDIYIYTWNGNNVYVTKDNGAWVEREKWQDKAIQKCNELLAMINIARRLFHLRGNKVSYWSQMVLETRGLIRKWREATVKQFRV